MVDKLGERINICLNYTDLIKFPVYDLTAILKKMFPIETFFIQTYLEGCDRSSQPNLSDHKIRHNK
jgi:hypothetical protein